MSKVVITQPQPSPDFYTAGGTLESTDPSYIERKADTELLEAVKRRQFCYVLTPRQMGKSSLMVRTAKGLQEVDISSVIIDLSAGDTTRTSAEKWYHRQVIEIADQLGLTGDYTWWWKRQIHLGPVQRFTHFLTKVALKKTTKPVVIFVDEIDTTLSLPFNTDDYFATIRALYNKRASDPDLKRLTFVLLGVVSPSDLIKDARRTPFNIGTRIQLTDFTFEEAKPLFNGLAPDPKLAEELLEQILFLTGGHPYLTQKTCMRVANWAKSEWDLSEAPVIVDELVENMFLSEPGCNTDDNIQFIRKRILESKVAKELLLFYRRVRSGELVLDNELDRVSVALKLSGIIKADDAGLLKVRNPIYERVFDESWVSRVLSEHEPQSTTEPEFTYDVFMSYSWRDRNWVADYLLPRLEAVGLRVWIDSQNLPLGNTWLPEIDHAITRCRNMLIILSPDMVASPWGTREYNAFLTNTKGSQRRLIPLLLKPTKVPLGLRSIHLIDFTQEKDWEHSMQQLLIALDIPQKQKTINQSVPVRFVLKSKRYNTATIRKLLNEAFEDEELMAFVYDYFRPLYEQLGTDMTKNQKLQKLIEYADGQKLFDQLLDQIAREKPRQYRRFSDQLEIIE